jgi:hypothetical protein
MTERSPFLSAGWGQYQTRRLPFANLQWVQFAKRVIGARIGLGSAPSGECRFIQRANHMPAARPPAAAGSRHSQMGIARCGPGGTGLRPYSVRASRSDSLR